MARIFLLITAVSVDGFVSAVCISSAGIKIPLRSSAIISLIGTLFLGAAVCFSDMGSRFISEEICSVVSTALMAGLGVFNLLHGILQKQSSRGENVPEAVKLYFDGTRADKDCSKVISCREAVFLAAALSADSLISGAGAGLKGVALIPLLICGFAAGMLAVCGGAYIGRHVVFTGRLNLQWIGGVLLLILAFVK